MSTSPEDYYGGSVIAMLGKDSVCLVSDKQVCNHSIITQSADVHTYKMTDKVYLALTGFLPDVQKVAAKIKAKVNLYNVIEGHDIEPLPFANLVSHYLYSFRRQPKSLSVIVAGLDKNNIPFICSMDCLGCKTEPKDFVAIGTASKFIVGVGESLWKEGLTEEDLMKTSVTAMLNACDANALSGWGARSILLSKNGCKTSEIRGRSD